MKHAIHHKSVVVLLILLFALWGPLAAMAVDDDIPFFAGRTGSPNVMIIFDNSNSMQDSAYKRDDGGSVYYPSTYWRRGAKINNGCDGDTSNDGVPPIENACIADDTPGVPGGSIQWDNAKYITTSTEIILPAQSTPHFPGIGASSSTITSIRDTSTECSDGMECDNRIYDSNVDFQYFVDNGWSSFSYTYQHLLIEITDTVDGSKQYRNLYSYSTGGGGNWRLFGDPVEYNPAHMPPAMANSAYVYRIVSGQPGEVTFPYLDTDGDQQPAGVDKRRVYDRNFEWGSITDWSYYATNYSYKILEVYEGTNAGEQRYLYSYSQGSGYWKVDSEFPEPCDSTTRYRILGEADDNLRASGGNHPDSKMYQAKEALTKFLNSDAIKTCDEEDDDGNCTDTRYLMNIGFSTFLQAQIPRTRARYYRKIRGSTVHHDPEFRFYYKRKEVEKEWPSNPNGCVNGEVPATSSFVYGGVTHDDVSVGYEFNRLYHEGSCDEQTIRYRVENMYCAPTDSLPNRLIFYSMSDPAWAPAAEMGVDPDGINQWGYTRYDWEYFADDGTHADCTTYPAPPVSNGWDLVAPGAQCSRACENIAAYDEVRADYYQVEDHTTYGDIRVSDSGASRYIDQTPAANAAYTVNPDKGHCSIPGDDWLCENPDPDLFTSPTDNYGDYKLVESVIENVPINADGDIGDITPRIYNYSYFRAPGRSGDIDHPHGWSYRRTERPDGESWTMDNGDPLDDHYIYAENTNHWSVWGDSVQRDIFFPSEPGDPLSKFSNNSGDDQTVFVDLPVVDANADDFGDDLVGENRNAILSYLSLARVPDPTNSSYVHTMAPISLSSLTVNRYEAVTGEGTPLGASLADARAYFKSYIEQDTFTQGGCRDNYIILLTDGLETAGGDPVLEAELLRQLSVNGNETPVKVYVIGFGLDAASQETLNDIAVAGGTGGAYFANNVDELVSILAHDITSDILSGSYGRSSASATKASQVKSSGLSVYYAYFDWPAWRGHLEAWDLYPENIYDEDTGELLHEAGQVKELAPYWANGCFYPGIEAERMADAGCIMATDYDDPGNAATDSTTMRNLFTTQNDGTRIAFHPDNALALQPLVNPLGLDINEDSNAGDVEDARAVINYILHPGYDDGTYVGTRDPGWPMADIYNSAPVISPAPPVAGCRDEDGDPATLDTWSNMTGYCAFQRENSSRETILYVGTNGGMIEAIAAGKQELYNADGTVSSAAVDGGRELWGYIPRNALSRLAGMKDGHKFTMDLSILSGSVDISEGLTGDWRTMLIAGQRQGGNSYTALDVTDPTDPQPMWEFTDSNLGQSWSEPSFGRVEINGNKISVVFFGGGYSPDSNKGNRLFIVRASDGVLLKELVVGSASNNVAGGIRTMRYLQNRAGDVVDYRTNATHLPDGTSVDYSDRKYFIETAYFGDSSGTIWRLDNLNSSGADPGNYGSPWSDNITVTPLYIPDATKAEDAPIYYKPVVNDIKKGVIDTDGNEQGCVRRYILAGTGDEQKEIETHVVGIPVKNYFFEIEDREWNSDDDDRVDSWSDAEKAAELASGRFRLNWRLTFGFKPPQSLYGFLLHPDADGSYVQKDMIGDGTDMRNILDSQVFILDQSSFLDGSFTQNKISYTGGTWSVVGGDLYYQKPGSDPTPPIEKIAGQYRFLIRSDDNLYSDPALTDLIAPAGSYYRKDISLWVTDRDGCFFDTDGSCLVDASLYEYNNSTGNFATDSAGTEAVIETVNVPVITEFGEKMLSAPSSLAGNVYFTTYSPEGGCAMGMSFIYGISGSTCGGPGGDGVLPPDAGGGSPNNKTGKTEGETGFTPGVTVIGTQLVVPTHNPEGLKTISIEGDPLSLKYWKQQ